MPHVRRSVCLSAAALLLAGGIIVPAGAQNVRQLYEQNCASCHGKGYAGGSASSLLDDEWVTDGSDRALYEAIHHGMEDHGMPGFEGGLSEAESWALVVYLRELRYDAREEQRNALRADAQGVWETRHESFTVETVAEGLDDFERPWAIDFLPDGKMLVTVRSGRLLVFDGQGEPRDVEGLPKVWQKGQGGMIDVAVHPDYPQPGNGWIYLSYSTNSKQDKDRGMTTIGRGRIDFQTMRWTDHEVLFRSDLEHDSPTGLHFGSRVVFDGDGHVFFTVGDRGQQERSQEPDRPNGRVHRIHEDGSIPEDNPFVDSGMPSSWTLGNRNMQGLSMHPATGRLYSVEHGPRGGDEINLIEKGRNYGWPVVSYTMNYNQTPFGENAPFHEEAGFVEPVHYWIPALGVCGSTFYTGEGFPKWNNDLFVASLVKQQLHRVRFDETGEKVAETELVYHAPGRIRDVAQGPDGSLLLALEAPGRILKLVPAE